MTLTFDWGFSDHTPQLSPLADVQRLYTEVAPLRPQMWRLNVPWNYVAKARDPGTAVAGAVPPTTTNRDWSYVDRCINDLLLKFGCDIILMIGQGRPQWGGWFFGWGATAGTSVDFQSFCAEVAQRYRPGGVGIRTDGIYAPNAGKGVTKFEMWNEVNNAHFWGNAVDPLDYTRFLIAGHAGIKSVLPGAASKVLFVGMYHQPRSAPFWGQGWGVMEEILFLQRCYDAAGKLGTTLGAHFDAMSEHIYTQADTVAYAPGTTLGPAPASTVDNLMQLQAIRALMVAKGDGAKGIYVTEAGYATHLNSAAEQNTFMQSLFNYLDTLPYIEAVLVYSARDAGTSGGGQDTYGALTWTWQRRPVFSWLQTITPDANRLIQPGPAVLTLIGSSPVIGNHRLVRPGAFALVVTGSAPDVRVTQNRTVQPGPATVLATGGVPAVVRTEHQFIQPGPAVLTIVGGQPNLGNAVTVRPAPAALVVTAGAPAVTVSDHKVVRPGGAAIAATGGAPAVTVTNHQRVVPGGAALTITMGAPVVTVSDHKLVTPGAAALTITMGTPTVTVASIAVTRVATGTMQRQTGSGVTRTITIPITIPAGTKELLVPVVTSHDGWYNYTAYSTFTAVSDVDGALSLELAVTGWPGGQPTGSAAFFRKTNPTAGTHNITVTFTVAGFVATSLQGTALGYAGVTSITGQVTANNTSASASSRTVAAGANDMAVYCGGFDGTPGTFNQTNIQNGGGAVAGIGDYILVGEAAGTGAAGPVTFTTATARMFEIVAMCLES